jgi:AcrR family transcriptional regulator
MQSSVPADATVLPASRHRRSRLAADEIRARMLGAATEMALKAGIGITVEDLSMEDVIQRARVPRSSVYRLWPYKGDFIDELLCHLAGPAGMFGAQDVLDPGTFDLAREVIARHSDMLGSAEGRRAVLCEVIRLSVSSNYHAHLNPRYRMHAALRAAVGSSQHINARGELATTLEKVILQSRARMVVLIQECMRVLGYRLRNPEWTAEHLQTATAAMIQGLAVFHDITQAAADCRNEKGPPDNSSPDPIINASLLGPGINGEPAEWTLVALAYLAIVDCFAEPDPDYETRANTESASAGQQNQR